MANDEIKPFKDQDVDQVDLPPSDQRFGSDVMRDVQELQVGAGATVFRANKSGIWLGGKTFATAPFRVDMNGNLTLTSLTLNTGNTTIDSSGNITTIGISSLNMKAYTNFEASGRFITSGDIAPAFGNQGMTLSPSGVANHYSRCLWWITNYVFNNNPTFTCSLLALNLNDASGDGAAWIGLGAATVSGGGYSYNTSHIGFTIRKSSGVINVGSSMNDGTVGGEQGANFLTIATGDSLELFIKVTATAVKFYYRKNGGTLTLGSTLSVHIPTASEQYISFSSTNFGTAFDFQVQVQCAAYEH